MNEASEQADASQALQSQQLQLELERDRFNKEQIEQMNEWARTDRADVIDRRDRARGLYDPLEEGIIDLAQKGPDYEGAAARSDADVSQAYGLQRAQERRRQQRYGINPASGRASAMERRVGNAEALAKTYGRNRSRMQEDDKDWTRRMAALGSGNMRNANATTNLAQLGVSGASGVLHNMSAAAGANAAGAAQFAGSLFADTMNRDSWNSTGRVRPPSGGVDMGNWMDPHGEDSVN